MKRQLLANQKKNSTATEHQNLLIVGALFWLATIQFYVVQVIVAKSWEVPFSYANNYISDLGNTLCTPEVCSPLYLLMNLSFILLGLCIIVGSVIFGQIYTKNTSVRLGFIGLALSGFGTILVGVFPSDSLGVVHAFGAFISFIIGNLALAYLSFVWTDIPKKLRVFGFGLGSIGLLALFCFLNNFYLGLGIGLLERIVAYPQTLWMITVASWYLLRTKGVQD